MPGSKPFFFVADGRRIVKPFLAEEIDKFYTMSAIMRGLIMRAPVASQLAVQRATIVSGPPRVRMSFVEKVVSGVVLVGCLLAVPLYVLGNIKNYRRMKGTL
ncbi:hypothetical protein NP493_488g00037 [Ridgeia piscesae]|uniref:Uncharacterized protein n=1 Tax=Ridgeia piscesae TaxID=27915 RepID=A0AAD9KY46_RIDPI|nr:hypothetical protein NP493_488g00037 [Ridgeia piscesae]